MAVFLLIFAFFSLTDVDDALLLLWFLFIFFLFFVCLAERVAVRTLFLVLHSP